ncbi:MAG TPA: alpha-glucosidase, partial [Trueperaceae bacterium]|nr:alpha-glucosidase [Trueperaceae bacterium]
VKARLDHQSVDAVEVGNDGLLLVGRLGAAPPLPGAAPPLPGTATILYRLRVTSVDAEQLEFGLELTAGDDHWAQLSWASRPGSAKYGFGVQFSRVDLSGRRVPLLTAEQGVGRGAQPLTVAAELLGGAGGQWWSTYAPAPFVLDSDLRALYLTDTTPMQFELRGESLSSVLVYRPRLTARIAAGSTPAELIEVYTRFAGRMAPLPDWAHGGAIVGLQGGEEKVEKVVADLRRHGAPLAGVWLQDWVGNRRVPFGQRLWWDWQLNLDTYPNWDRLVADLAQQGLNVLIYVNPFLADMRERPGGRPDLLGAAIEGSHLVKDASGRTYLTDQGDFEAGLVDLSDPAARDWYLHTLTEQIAATGALGWMADFGEGLPLDAVLANGDAVTWHNHYPQAWADFNRELRHRLAARSGHDPGDYVAFFRSGYAKSPAGASLFWLGDQTVTWDGHDGLRSALKGLLSSGFSGYSLQHGDVGGYTSTVSPLPRRVRTRELLARWGELMAFTVVLRTHEGNRPALNTQVYSTEETLADFARSARIHAAWRDLRRQLMEEAASTGMPVVRHPWLAYHDDDRTKDLETQFFLGHDVLVAPVLWPSRTSVEAYLPAGSGIWTHVFGGGPDDDAADDDAEHAARDGRWVSVPAPLGRPGVFVRCHDEATRALAHRLREAVAAGES